MTDADGTMSPWGSDIGPTPPSGGSWQADAPSLSIQDCDEDGNPINSPVIGGQTAYFLVSLANSSSMPQQADVDVFYRTLDGSLGSGNVAARGGVDYEPTYGTKETTLSFGSDYRDVIAIDTIASPDQTVGSFTLIACWYDANANIPPSGPVTASYTIQQSWWSISRAWSYNSAANSGAGANVGSVTANGNPTLEQARIPDHR